MKVNLDTLAEWFVSWGFGADVNFGSSAPLELIYPVAKAWHRRERARGEDSGLGYWIDILQEEQVWERHAVDTKIQDIYQIVQLRKTDIVGVVRAKLDDSSVLLEYGNDNQYQIVVPRADLLVLDGIVFDLGENGHQSVTGG